jgi:FG-GAP-like repeat
VTTQVIPGHDGTGGERRPQEILGEICSLVILSRTVAEARNDMNSEKCGIRLWLGCLLIVLSAAAVCAPPLAGAQAFLFGRADFPATPNPTNVVIADFNGDGRPDMAVSDSQHNWVSILLGSANGGFVAEGTYATGSSPTALAAADFNGDKKIDLAVVDSYSGTISILLGNGDGTFQGRVDYPVGQSPSGIVAADFNGDGKIDMATISTNDSSVAILLGNGKGSFAVQALIPVASSPTGLVGGDVNGDGKIDLITSSNYYSSEFTVLVSNGDGTFKQVESEAPSYSVAFVVGDFNRDGKLDIISDGGSELYLSLGNGDGSFQDPVTVANVPYSYTQGLVAGDFNHDNKLDVAVAGIWVLLGNGDGTFQNPIVSPSVATPMATVDVNGDGELDLAAYTNFGTVAVLLGDGNGSFMDVRAVALAASSYYPEAAVAADFNGDGKLDLVVAEGNYPNGQLSVELGKGNGTFGSPIVSALSTTATQPTEILAADFNGDGKPDVVVEDDNGASFQVLMGRGNGSFGTPVDNPLTYQISSFVAGDFNRDGKADLAVLSSSNSPFLTVYLSNGDGTFTTDQQYVVYPNSYVTAADVNGDGNLDLIVSAANYYGSGTNLLVYLGKGDGTFENPLFGPADNYTSQAAVGDFNGDGKLDIAIGTGNGIAFLAGNGDGTFAQQVYSNTGLEFSGSIVAADFSGDRKLDVGVRNAYSSPGTTIMRGNGDGTFGPPVEYDSNPNGYVTGGIMAGDFNSDGVSDLGMPGETSTSGNTPVVFLYLSTPTPSFHPSALSFGAELVGKTSPPKNVRLTNSGNSKLKISKISVSGDFLEQNTCAKGLLVGKSCTIQVSFKPEAKGILKGELSIADNAPGKTQKISLEGVGK